MIEGSLGSKDFRALLRNKRREIPISFFMYQDKNTFEDLIMSYFLLNSEGIGGSGIFLSVNFTL